MRLIFLSIVLLIASSTNAGNNDKSKKKKKLFSITGKVVDREESLVGVKVLIDNHTIYTDLEGNFKIDNIEEGSHMISFDLITYEPLKLTVDPKKDENIVVDLVAK